MQDGQSLRAHQSDTHHSKFGNIRHGLAQKISNINYIHTCINQFELDDEEFDYERLNKYSRTSLYLENFIQDFLICISDGDTHPDKNFNDYFEFSPKEALFPRARDVERFKNMDHYI